MPSNASTGFIGSVSQVKPTGFYMGFLRNGQIYHFLMLNYAELDCISNFTFLHGASHPHELVKRAAELGYQALALCDECSLSGIVRAYQAAKQHHKIGRAHV